MTTSKIAERHLAATPTPPPFRPDPDLIGNIEGNDRIRRGDQAAARRYLEDHDLESPSEDTKKQDGPAA